MAALHGGKGSGCDGRQDVQAADGLQALVEASQHHRSRERGKLRNAWVAGIAQPGAAGIVPLVQALGKLSACLQARSSQCSLRASLQAHGLALGRGALQRVQPACKHQVDSRVRGWAVCIPKASLQAQQTTLSVELGGGEAVKSFFAGRRASPFPHPASAAAAAEQSSASRHRSAKAKKCV